MGSVRSIWGKTLEREIVNTHSAYRLGVYVYVTGADDMPNNSLYRYGAALPVPTLTAHPAAHGRVVSFQSSANMETAVLESSAPYTPQDSYRNFVAVRYETHRTAHHSTEKFNSS